MIQNLLERFRKRMQLLRDQTQKVHRFEWCVLVDNSGSMGRLDRQVQETLVLLMETLRRMECRFAIGRFGARTNNRLLKALGSDLTHMLGQQILESFTYDEGALLRAAPLPAKPSISQQQEFECALSFCTRHLPGHCLPSHHREGLGQASLGRRHDTPHGDYDHRWTGEVRTLWLRVFCVTNSPTISLCALVTLQRERGYGLQRRHEGQGRALDATADSACGRRHHQGGSGKLCAARQLSVLC